MNGCYGVKVTKNGKEYEVRRVMDRGQVKLGREYYAVDSSGYNVPAFFTPYDGESKSAILIDLFTLIIPHVVKHYAKRVAVWFMGVHHA